MTNFFAAVIIFLGLVMISNSLDRIAAHLH